MVYFSRPSLEKMEIKKISRQNNEIKPRETGSEKSDKGDFNETIKIK